MENEQHRYSREDLEEFEKIILAKMAKLEKENTGIAEIVTKHKNSGKKNYFISLQMELRDKLQIREDADKVANRNLENLYQLRKALIRIKDGTYGICEITGILIPVDTLCLHPEQTSIPTLGCSYPDIHSNYYFFE